MVMYCIFLSTSHLWKGCNIIVIYKIKKKVLNQKLKRPPRALLEMTLEWVNLNVIFIYIERRQYLIHYIRWLYFLIVKELRGNLFMQIQNSVSSFNTSFNPISPWAEFSLEYIISSYGKNSLNFIFFFLRKLTSNFCFLNAFLKKYQQKK